MSGRSAGTSLALVTGASSGIGEAFAHLLASEGFDLVLVARREPRLRKLKETLERAHGIRVETRVCDLADAEQVDRLQRESTRGPRGIDLLVNCAGFGAYGRCHELEWDRQRNMIAVNVTALTQLCWSVGRDMATRGGGGVINVASTAGLRPGPGNAVYAATKAYVLALSEALACELAGSNLAVTALLPGPTQSEFADVASLARRGPGRTPAPAAEVARFGYAALCAGRPVAIHGLSNRLLALLPRILPRRLLLWMLTRRLR